MIERIVALWRRPQASASKVFPVSMKQSEVPDRSTRTRLHNEADPPNLGLRRYRHDGCAPCPGVLDGQVLVRSHVSLISSGTERMLLEFGKANWIEKARQQPDKVRMVFEKARTDGLVATLQAVEAKLDQCIEQGYCNSGEIVESGVRVVSNGPHAQMVSVPKNLCASIPDGVSDDEAAFTVVGAIALQGIRLAKPTLGETFVVTGLGLIGLMAVQLLRAHGCRVLGIDYDSRKIDLARQFGAEVVDLSRGLKIQSPLRIASLVIAAWTGS